MKVTGIARVVKVTVKLDVSSYEVVIYTTDPRLKSEPGELKVALPFAVATQLLQDNKSIKSIEGLPELGEIIVEIDKALPTSPVLTHLYKSDAAPLEGTDYNPTFEEPKKFFDELDSEEPFATPYYPVTYPKIYFNSESGFRIGAVELTVPVKTISGTRESFVSQVGSLRSKDSVKNTKGQSYETYVMQMEAQSVEQIRTEIAPLIKQCSLMPFLAVDGGPFGGTDDLEGTVPHKEIAIRNITVSTVPNHPQKLAVSLGFDPFLWDWYLKPSRGAAGKNSKGEEVTFPRTRMDDAICYPLFELWVKSNTSRVNENLYREYSLSPEFSLYAIEQPESAAIDRIAANSNTYNYEQDALTLRQLQRLVEGENRLDPQSNIRILNSLGAGATQYAVVKVSNVDLFERLVGIYRSTLTNRHPSSNFTTDKLAVGLVDWNSLPPVLADSQGIRIFNSITIDEDVNFVNVGMLDEINENAFSQGLPIIDLKNTTRDINTVISNFLINQQYNLNQRLGKTTSVEDSEAEVASTIKAAIEDPHVFFGVVIPVAGHVQNFKLFTSEISSLAQDFEDQLGETRTTTFRDRVEEFYNMDSSVTKGPKVFSITGKEEDEIFFTFITGSRRHNLSVLSARTTPLPTHQYLGSMGAEFHIQGICTSLEARNKLRRFKEQFDASASATDPMDREKIDPENPIGRVRLHNNYLRVVNPIFDLLECKFVIPTQLSFETVENYPGVYSFTLSFTEYSPEAANSERLQLLQTYSQTRSQPHIFGSISPSYDHPAVQEAKDYFSLQSELATVEMYPDLKLPSSATLTYWIKQIKDAAASAFYNAPNPGIDSEIMDLVLKYGEGVFKYNIDCIRLWKEFKPRSRFIDPDFFCCYSTEESFTDLVKSVLNRTVGKDQGNGSALGGALGVIRMLEPDNNFVTLISPGDTASNKTTAIDEVELQQGKVLDNDTLEPSELIKEYESVTQEALEAGRAKGWWAASRSGLVNVGSRLGSIIDDSIFNQNFSSLDPSLTIPIDDYGDNEGGEVRDNPITNFSSKLQPYFTLAWRAQQLQEFANRGSTHARASNFTEYGWSDEAWILNDFRYDAQIDPKTPLLGDLKFLTGSDVATEVFGLDLLLKDEFYYSLNGITREKAGTILTSTPGGWTPKKFSVSKEEFIAESFVNQASLGTYNVGKTINQILFNSLRGEASVNLSGGDALSRIPFLDRVFFTNAYWAYAQQSPNFAAKDLVDTPSGFLGLSQPDAFHRAKNNFVNALSIGAKHNVDPHIISAFAMTRTEMHGRNPNGKYSMFDLSPNFRSNLPSITEGLSDSEAVAAVFRHYMEEYNDVVTLALIATDIALTNKAENLFDTKTKTHIYHDLFIQTSKNPTVPNIRAAVTSIESTIAIDSYYISWLEHCRCFGPYLPKYGIRSKDPFFDYRNPLILMDIGRNNKGRFLQSSYSPTGSSIVVRASRADLGFPLLTYVGNFESQKLTAEEQSDLNKRQATTQAPHTEDAIWGIFEQMRRMRNVGRLVSAFPSFCFMIVNEGQYFQMGSTRLWDQYFTRLGVSSMDIVQSRELSGSVANIVITNQFRKLTNYTGYERMLDNLVDEQRELVFASLKRPFKTISDAFGEFVAKSPSPFTLEAWKRSYLNLLVLTPGARLLVRAGYGGNAAKLPTIFAGTIVDVQSEGPALSLTALGDGHELEKKSTNKLSKEHQGFKYKDGAVFGGAGKSPSVMVAEAITPFEGISSVIARFTNGSFGIDRSHGIAHFGDIVLDRAKYSRNMSWYNVYDSGQTVLEQQIPHINNYFNSVALTGWLTEKNWFSVSISEPTPWKVVNVCRKACMDFVTYACPFASRSSLFFGKWWWPLNYEYKPSILDYAPIFTDDVVTVERTEGISTSPEKVQRALYNSADLAGHSLMAGTDVSEKIVSDLEVKVEEELRGVSNPEAPYQVFSLLSKIVANLNWRPFGQFYIIDDSINLLDASIKLDSRTVVTDAYGINTYNAIVGPSTVTKTMLFSVDSDIHPSSRQTASVDTGLMTTPLQRGVPGLARSLATTLTLTQLANLVFPGVSEYVNGIPGTMGVNNSVVQYLVDSVKTMYQGNITIQGLPTAKPHDFAFYRDARTGLKGMIQFRDVIHRIDPEVGYITVISPDAVAFPASHFQGIRMIRAASMSIIPRILTLWGAQQGLLYAYLSSKAALKNGRYSKALGRVTAKRAKLELLRVYLEEVPYDVDAAIKQFKAAGIDVSDDYIKEMKVNAAMRTRLVELINQAINKSTDLNLDPDVINDIAALKFSNAAELREASRTLMLEKADGDLAQIIKNIQGELIDLRKEYPNSEILKVFSDHFERELLEEEIEDLIALLKDDEKIWNDLDVRSKDTGWDLWKRRYSNSGSRSGSYEIDLEEARQIIRMYENANVHNPAIEALPQRIKLLYIFPKADPDNLTAAVRSAMLRQTIVKDLPKETLNRHSDQLAALIHETVLSTGTDDLDTIQDEIKKTIRGYLESLPDIDPGDPYKNLDVLDNIDAHTDQFFEDVQRARRVNINSQDIKKSLNFVQKYKDLKASIDSGAVKSLFTADSINDLFKGGGKGIRGLVTTFRVAKSSLVWTIAVDLAVQALGSSFIDAFNNYLAARQVVKIMPLTNSANIPFVAGIRGHAGAVIGDSPGILDEIYMGILGDPGEAGFISQEVALVGGIVAGLMGVNPPNYRPTKDELVLAGKAEE